MNVPRLSLYLTSGHIFITAHLIIPMRQFHKNMARNFGRYSADELRTIMFYFHRMFIYHLLEHEYIDRQVIRGFFAKAFIYVMFFCLINTAALITGSYNYFLAISVIVFIAVAMLMLSLAIFYFIYETNSLTLSAPQLATVLSIRSYGNDELEKRKYKKKKESFPLYRAVKVATFFELIHSRRKFHFHLGSFGTISSKSWIGFALFYSGWVLTLMSDYF